MLLSEVSSLLADVIALVDRSEEMWILTNELQTFGSKCDLRINQTNANIKVMVIDRPNNKRTGIPRMG